MILVEINELENKTTEKINETKNVFFEKIKKIGKPFSKLTIEDLSRRIS